MKSLAIPATGAALAVLLAVGITSAADPTAAPAATAVPAWTAAPTVAPAATPAAPAAGATTGVVAAILGLTDAEVMTLRSQGLSLAQIAERQKVDPQKLVDALAAQWSVRIDARLAAGAITADQAKALKDNVAVQAKAMVYQATMGGMRGAAVGAGPNGGMRGMGAGMGTGAAGGRGPAANGGRMGAGRGGMMGAAGGTGTCPYVSPAPSAPTN